MARPVLNPYDIRDLVPGEAPMTEENVRRVNAVRQLTRRFHDGSGRVDMEDTEIARIAFEEGIDAGRKWGHEEKDEEWRDEIRQVIQNSCGPCYRGLMAIPVEHIEALL